MLTTRLRHSPPARLAAAGFILVVLFGNLWLAQALTGGHPPVWIGAGFAIGIALALLGGVGLAGVALMARLRGGVEDPDAAVPGEDSSHGEGEGSPSGGAPRP